MPSLDLILTVVFVDHPMQYKRLIYAQSPLSTYEMSEIMGLPKCFVVLDEVVESPGCLTTIRKVSRMNEFENANQDVIA